MKTVQCVALAMAVAAAAAGPAMAGDLVKPVRDYVAAHQKEIVAELDALTRLRSVAADPAGLKATAAHLEAQLKARGFDAAQFTQGASPPVVFGSLVVPGAKRTVVFYAHYDGQPVTPSEWASDPFTPVMRSGPLNTGERAVEWKTANRPFDPEWRLFGRAVADDKASIVAFLAAFDALKAAGRTPSVNIKVVWEGEEEAGSPHLAQILRANKERLASDLWLIGDGPVHQSRKPMIGFGARGVVDVEATIYGPVRAPHDGHYGNWVPNPAVMAAELIASMRDSEGRILIPKFSDDVRPPSEAERAAAAALPPVEDAIRREFGIGRSEGNEGVVMSTLRPALNVRGIRAGQVGESAANAVPVTAMVSIDFRLVPNQTPARVREKVEAFLRAQGWTIVTEDPNAPTRLAHKRIVKLAWGEGYPAHRADMTSPAAHAVIAAATSAAGGQVALLPTMGGSVPLFMFDEAFGVPIINLPIVNHDNSQHAANENLRLQNLWDGIGTYAAMMAELNW
jgi:acetylornithine deacetylase/succinyl-diaminopimelate desuccinylase-like protein